MVKGKLERKYKLIHNGRELSKGLLSEAGKYDAMQILVQRFDEGREDAIDPDEVEIIDMSLKENQYWKSSLERRVSPPSDIIPILCTIILKLDDSSSL